MAAARAAAEATTARDEDGVGLVPTMGYLHEGHLSLARRARQENALVVMSIFVNPTQFGPNEDLSHYPRDLERDLFLAEEEGVDLVFHPPPEEMYLPGHATWVDVEGLTEHLCGASRPGHFRGVSTVVTKLFGICRPDRAYFGQKDAQQAFVIRRLTADLDLGVEVVVCPTVREPDGLALSSRNVYLTEEERAEAPVLYRALRSAEALIASGERDARLVVRDVLEVLAQSPHGRVDYVEVVDTATLQPLEILAGEVLLALAVWFGGTRLIDNLVVRVG
ncbi:MAG: pantoate--beta-alanine ligase [Thermoleophilia bacterium]|nr:pantoate--beta-alanine ligase [Thermoleophilia bacterium]